MKFLKNKSYDGSLFPVASSMTHQHLMAVVNTILDNSIGTRKTVRILDLGCGDGKLISYLSSALPKLKPNIYFEVFGLDISDSKQQKPDFMEKTKNSLLEVHPDIDWDKRLAVITECDYWPYLDQTFDFIISNQVFEHVMDHSFVFGEIHRCLQLGGVSVNLFPLREVLWEAHAHMPLVHKVKNENRRALLILFFAKIGFRARYKRENSRWNSLEDFSKKYSHTLQTATNYLSAKQLVSVAIHSGLTPSFCYTKDFYIAKLFSYFGYRFFTLKSRGLLDKISFIIGKRISNVTVLLSRMG